jgi:hypothetical protein
MKAGNRLLTWKQIVYGLDSSVALAECKNDLSAPPAFWDLRHFCMYNHLRVGVQTALWFTHRCVVNRFYEARPGNSNILSQIIDISYIM